MTKADIALLRRVQARIRRLRPDLAAALLQSLDAVRDLLTEAEVRDLLAGRTSFAALFSDVALVRALAPYRAALRKTVEASVRLTIPDLPVPKTATAEVLFDYLNPKVVTALREFETTALGTLTEQVRESTRIFVESGLRSGAAPREVARQLRTVIGIAPHQERFVQNYERDLRELNVRALGRELTDARYDTAVRKAIASGTPLTEAQITKRVDIYRRNFANYNTEVVTRQVTVDAYRNGQRLAWQGAVDNGFLDHEGLWRTWVHSDAVTTPRPDHLARDGETVRFDQPYSDGSMVAGLGFFNCECTDRYSTRAPKQATRRARADVNL